MQSYITLGELSKAVELYFTAEDPIEANIYINNCALQPERLNPEDASNSVCDSLNTANK